MGDYTKLIVNAEVSAPIDELNAKIAELPRTESAYHCEGGVVSVTQDGYHKDHHHVTIVCQTKYGRGQEEFLTWLEPFVTQGSGERELWAIQMHEYGTGQFWYMHPEAQP